jgi:hypothetical protein
MTRLNLALLGDFQARFGSGPPLGLDDMSDGVGPAP